MAESGPVEVPPLRDRERGRRQGEADVRVRQLGAKPLAALVDGVTATMGSSLALGRRLIALTVTEPDRVAVAK